MMTDGDTIFHYWVLFFIRRYIRIRMYYCTCFDKLILVFNLPTRKHAIYKKNSADKLAPNFKIVLKRKARRRVDTRHKYNLFFI